MTPSRLVLTRGRASTPFATSSDSGTAPPARSPAPAPAPEHPPASKSPAPGGVSSLGAGRRCLLFAFPAPARQTSPPGLASRRSPATLSPRLWVAGDPHPNPLWCTRPGTAAALSSSPRAWRPPAPVTPGHSIERIFDRPSDTAPEPAADATISGDTRGRCDPLLLGGRAIPVAGCVDPSWQREATSVFPPVPRSPPERALQPASHTLPGPRLSALFGSSCAAGWVVPGV